MQPGKALAPAFIGAAMTAWLCGLAGCASPAPSVESGAYRPVSATGLGRGVYARPGSAHAGRWAVLLPGSSGLKIFDDDQHYFRAADTISTAGFDVLVVDYKAAYRGAATGPAGTTGSKIAWVVEQVINEARRNGAIREGEQGALVAWSLGAEGLWDLFENGRAEAMGVAACVAYYPSNEDGVPLDPPVPVLVLQGERDNVTPAAQVRAWLKPSAMLEVVYYPGAHHGFDVASLSPARTVSLIPFIGPRGTFGFDDRAAPDSADRTRGFLDRSVARR